MLRSLYSGVAGLKTHQTKMDVIGNNIANVNTYGFKASRVTFRDMFYQTVTQGAAANGNIGGTNSTQIGYGSAVGSIDLINTRSGFASTGKATDCYIDGEGYFVLKDTSGNERLTRVGQMDFDGSGNLVDPSGNFVCGYPVDYMYSQAKLGTGTTINFGQTIGSTLDGYSVVVKYGDVDTGLPASTTAIDTDNTNKIITVTYTPNSDTAVLTNNDLGTALADAGNWTTLPTGVTDVTGITVEGDDATTVSAQTALVDQVPSFDYTQQPQKIINTYGQLINTSITPDGMITGQTQNGKIVVIGQLAIANVPNPQSLNQDGNTYFKASSNTGAITYAPPGSDNLGTLKTSGLEMSNVDLSNEFSDMIMTERGFQANSKIITVSDEMLETLVNLKR